MASPFQGQQQQLGIIQLYIVTGEPRHGVAKFIELRELIGDSVLARERKDFIVGRAKANWSDLNHGGLDLLKTIRLYQNPGSYARIEIGPLPEQPFRNQPL